jgi:hypothetical protein
MFYNNSDKLIYTAPSCKKYDPLDVYRKLIVISKSQLNNHLSDWQITDQPGGDTDANRITAAIAEHELVRISRETFALKPFDEGTGDLDADAINVLVDYLEWLAKKEKPVAK